MRGPWNWSCGRSWSAWYECWESTKPGSSARAAIVTNCWGISPAFCPYGKTDHASHVLKQDECLLLPNLRHVFYLIPFFSVTSSNCLVWHLCHQNSLEDRSVHRWLCIKFGAQFWPFEKILFSSYRSNSFTAKKCLILVCLSTRQPPLS